MGKTRVRFECTACGAVSSQWQGRCAGCGGWGTIEEERRTVATSTGAPVAPTRIGDEEPEERLPIGFEGLDRVLGGGLVPGSVVLLAGEPGIGKSTLLLQVIAALEARGHGCLLASGEETRGQIATRARRLGIADRVGAHVPGRELPVVLEAARLTSPALLVVDSIQAIRDPEHTGLPGGAAQVRLCADRLVGLAKETGTAVILTGQVTKDGEIAGPRTLEHAVDVICSFDGDPRTGLRVLAGGKNRFGPEGELAWFEMGRGGLREADPSAVLATAAGEPGAAVALLAAGRRALAVEIQALAAPTEGPARRQATGLDPKRFGLVAAVLDQAAGLGLARSELYGATAGGLRVDDPGCDLAVAAALASAATGVAPPEGAAFVGEVGLTGVVRSAPNLQARLQAAATAGVTAVYTGGTGQPPAGVRLIRVARLRDALGWALGDRFDRRSGNGPPAGAREAV